MIKKEAVWTASFFVGNRDIKLIKKNSRQEQNYLIEAE
jgi:hypothetical protein